MIQSEDFDKNQQLALMKLNDFKFDSGDNLSSDVLMALAFCKIYNESEHRKFVVKCKAFKLYTQIVRQEIESYVRKLKHLIKQENKLKKVKNKQEEEKEFEERRSRGIVELQKLQDQPPNDERNEIMIAFARMGRQEQS